MCWLKAVKDSEDSEDIKAKTEALQKSFLRSLGKIYKQANPNGNGGGMTHLSSWLTWAALSPQGGSSDTKDNDDGVIDADYTESK